MGPLSGLKVVELAGLGAGPFAAMMLADMGADVVRVDRLSDPGLGVDLDPRHDLLLRGRRSVAVDLKTDSGREAALKLIDRADVLIESFRPGVTERLGLGPQVCMERNPRLIYGRMTGWGQNGPYATMAGHDINYIALAGVLDAIGPADGPPSPPLNLVGDFGGAIMFGFGLMCAAWEVARSGRGQIVDAAMVDSSAYLMTMIQGFRHAGVWTGKRADNVIDGGAPFYGAYRTSDGKYIAVGAIEEKFYDQLLRKLELDGDADMKPQMDRAKWPTQRGKIAAAIARHSRQEWCERLEGTDACFSPVLSLEEAESHPHLHGRNTFIEIDGYSQPAPAPRFSRSEPAVPSPPPVRGSHTREVLADWGFPENAVCELITSGAVMQA